MNFILGTLLIILFLFPGFIFRVSYLGVSHGRSFKSSIMEELFFSVVPCLLIHLLFIPVTFLFGFDVDGFYLLMINNANATDWMENTNFVQILFYFLTTFSLGFLCGILFRL